MSQSQVNPDQSRTERKKLVHEGLKHLSEVEQMQEAARSGGESGSDSLLHPDSITAQHKTIDLAKKIEEENPGLAAKFREMGARTAAEAIKKIPDDPAFQSFLSGRPISTGTSEHLGRLTYNVKKAIKQDFPQETRKNADVSPSTETENPRKDSTQESQEKSIIIKPNLFDRKGKMFEDLKALIKDKERKGLKMPASSLSDLKNKLCKVGYEHVANRLKGKDGKAHLDIPYGQITIL